MTIPLPAVVAPLMAAEAIDSVLMLLRWEEGVDPRDHVMSYPLIDAVLARQAGRLRPTSPRLGSVLDGIVESMARKAGEFRAIYGTSRQAALADQFKWCTPPLALLTVHAQAFLSRVDPAWPLASNA